jgi:RNA polymerase sigma-70 factor, ECF subfamily
MRAGWRMDLGGALAMRTDADLAEAFRNGDDLAYSILYDRYRHALYGFALKMLGEVDAASDLVQDVFLTIYERRSQLNHPENFRSWLFAIGRNRCLSRLRQDRGRTSLEEAPEEALAVEAPSHSLEAEHDVRLIRQALGRLKFEYREVLVLREYQDLSYREIAEIIETTESAVKSRLFKARRALHEMLKPAFAGWR